MSALVIPFKHNIQETVFIKAIEVVGRVDAVSMDERGEMYRVVYWNDGQRNAVWMYDWELEEKK
jgi:ribosomal protein S4E